MKTVTKLIMSAVVLFGIMITGNSCKKERAEDTPHGYMTVKMTDAPADYSGVFVEIVGMNVHTQSYGWINIPVKKGIYNLLELQNNTTVILSNGAALPIGETSQIRLILGSSNFIVTAEGRQYPLKVPSGDESGLKINVHETIENGEHVLVVLDFDAKASVVVNGSGEFSLKPVITVKSITQL